MSGEAALACVRGADGLCLTHDAERFTRCEASIRAEASGWTEAQIKEVLENHTPNGVEEWGYYESYSSYDCNGCNWTRDSSLFWEDHIMEELKKVLK